jgi:hypothetical protein
MRRLFLDADGKPWFVADSTTEHQPETPVKTAAVNVAR